MPFIQDPPKVMSDSEENPLILPTERTDLPAAHFRQISVDEPRKRWTNFQIILDRYVDNIILHAVLFITICCHLSFILTSGNYTISATCRNISLTLIVFALFDVLILFLTGYLHILFSLYWVEVSFKLAALITWSLGVGRLEQAAFLLLAYLLDGPRYIQKCRLLICVNKRIVRLEDNRQLDLCYINNRVIALAEPSYFPYTLYRNTVEDIKSYFTTYYPGGHFLVNMCEECSYRQDHFYRVSHFPTPDHEVPTLQMLANVCLEVEDFFRAAPEKAVAAFHCKGGKGRTGLVVAAWLIYSKFCKTAKEAIELFAERRTDPALCGGVKTVTNPCQIRFLRYFEEFVNRYDCKWFDAPRVVRLCHVQLTGINKKIPLQEVVIALRPHPKMPIWQSFDSMEIGNVRVTHDPCVELDTGRPSLLEWTLTWCDEDTSQQFPGTRPRASPSSDNFNGQHLNVRTNGGTHMGVSTKEGSFVMLQKGEMKDVICVEVYHRCPRSEKRELLCFTWLHADLLEVPTLHLNFQRKAGRYVEEVEETSGDRPCLYRETAASTRPKISVPLIGGRDLDARGNNEHKKTCSLTIIFEVFGQERSVVVV